MVNIDPCADDVNCRVGHLCCTDKSCCYGLKGVTSDGVDDLNKFVVAVLVLSIIWLVVHAIALGLYAKAAAEKKKYQKVDDTNVDMQSYTSGGDGGEGNAGDGGEGDGGGGEGDAGGDTARALHFPHDIKLKVYPSKRR